jgi:hypothetical protein
MSKPRLPVSTIVQLATLCEYALTFAFVSTHPALRGFMRSIATQCAQLAEITMRDHAKRMRAYQSANKATP